jgi:predicted unusual protein kinase regulating ubiquinone biosynthesis (AarF/ABC1/UbiB family)
LAGLQDEVAAEPFEPMRALIEAELGGALEEKFSYFNPVSLAAASIGQVYSARLAISQAEDIPSPSVVVKVQRPHIEEIVKVDMAALRIVGGWLQKYPPIRKRADVPKLMEEFSRSLYEEIDYLHEGKNAEIFAENFSDIQNVRVPKVIWSHTTKRVLTLEDVGGIKITDYEAIEAVGIDRTEVAKRLLNTYLKQVFEDGFFHADPHPGNLFVEVPAGAEIGAWNLTFVDFGMTGTIPENMFKALREVLISVGTQDVHRLVEAFRLLDILLPGADSELLERAAQRVFQQVWGKSTTQIVNMHAEEAREFIDEFGDLLFEMPFQLPENLILLGRCASILSGMCSGLDPDFNVWESFAPYVHKLTDEEGNGKLETVLEEIGKVFQNLVSLPGKTDALITRMEQGRLEVRSPALVHEVERLERSQRKTAGAVVFFAFLFCGVQLYLANDLVLAAGFGVAAALALLQVVIGK